MVESICEWVVEGCERLTELWGRIQPESQPEDPHKAQALRSLLTGAAARATAALAPLNPPNHVPQTVAAQITNSLSPIGLNSHKPDPEKKDPRVVNMMQQYTDMLVNMVQLKMAQQPPPPGPD